MPCPHFSFKLLGDSRRKDATDEVRQLVFQTLLARSNNGRLGKKVRGEVAAQFGLGLQTVQKIWKRSKASLAQGTVADVKSRKRGCSGQKETPIGLEPLHNIPLNERMTLDEVSRRLHVGKAKLIRYMRKGQLRRHSNNIKPYLTEANKKTRLKWCVNMIDQESTSNDQMFKALFDHVFIDEKWFFLTQNFAKYYLLPDEDDTHHTSKSNNYIPRLMLLCVTARPRF
ncbi:hypothetical protein PR202_gn00316 [Eleusine coracana subsp. coracana]|uniref:DUF7769 domain-containing protein n=1 Tax=Eleusine coracana subsp. coracana TaxID=191504 RepID=A0AAV5G1U3_ELECO|nr:hypothetical protein PR202_gn00211 [Eleusine coracana subsp. coracana]GJN40998.1 hypothetical protein PR202_gn00316 [Eleusine coracana subsp. coracana]